MLLPLNYTYTLSTHGATMNVWNSISYAACELVLFHPLRVLIKRVRLGLRQLGSVDERDHKSLVIRVFWR